MIVNCYSKSKKYNHTNRWCTILGHLHYYSYFKAQLHNIVPMYLRILSGDNIRDSYSALTNQNQNCPIVWRI